MLNFKTHAYLILSLRECIYKNNNKQHPLRTEKIRQMDREISKLSEGAPPHCVFITTNCVLSPRIWMRPYILTMEFVNTPEPYNFSWWGIFPAPTATVNSCSMPVTPKCGVNSVSIIIWTVCVCVCVCLRMLKYQWNGWQQWYKKRGRNRIVLFL